MPVSAIWVSLAIMVVSIAGRIFFNNLSCIMENAWQLFHVFGKTAGNRRTYETCSYGYFNENRLGEIVAAVTTTLGDIESNASWFWKSSGGLSMPLS